MSNALDTNCSLSVPMVVYSPISPGDNGVVTSLYGTSPLPSSEGIMYSASPLPNPESSPSPSMVTTNGLYRPMTPPDASPNSGLLGSSGFYTGSGPVSDQKLNVPGNNGFYRPLTPSDTSVSQNMASPNTLYSPNSPADINANAVTNSSVFNSPNSTIDSDGFHVPSPSQFSGYETPENLMYSPQWGRETPKSEPLDHCDSGFSKTLMQQQPPLLEPDYEIEMANDPKLIEDMQSFIINNFPELEQQIENDSLVLQSSAIKLPSAAQIDADGVVKDFFSTYIVSSRNPRAWLEQDVFSWMCFIIQRFSLEQEPSSIPPLNGRTLMSSSDAHLTSLVGPDLSAARRFLHRVDPSANLEQMVIKKEEIEDSCPQIQLPATVESPSGAPRQQALTQSQPSYNHLQTPPQSVNSFEASTLDYILDNIGLENNNNSGKRVDAAFPSHPGCPPTHLEPLHSSYPATPNHYTTTVPHQSTTVPHQSYVVNNTAASSTTPSLVQDMVFNTNVCVDDPADSDSEDAPPSPPSGGRHHIQLYQFLKLMLNNHRRYGASIRWINREEGIFKIENSTEVARQWGIRKNRPKMNYDKMSRSIRQYYDKGVMKKTLRPQRLVYQFCAKYAQ